jgi:signal transduction histidine kinase
MRAIASLRRRGLELSWVAFVLANVAAMALWPRWETIPFHLIWTSLTLLYGLRVWRPARTYAVLLALGLVTGGLILSDAFDGTQAWGELFEVPLMSAMFLAMVWHARRRQEAIRATARLADERAALLAQQEQFLHDVSHELRTPVTIARGHLEMAERVRGQATSEVSVALDELDRIERIVEQLLLLARAGQPNFPDFAVELDLETFLEDVVMRWAEVAPRVWRVGALSRGTLHVDPDALRIAIDALVENAVKYTAATEAIEVRSRATGGEVAIDVVDEGYGVPPTALGEIFERFTRADAAGTRRRGGVGLGLAIVGAIAEAHGGRCTVRSSAAGTTFTLVLPRFTPDFRGRGEGAVALGPAPPGRMPAEGALTEG